MLDLQNCKKWPPKDPMDSLWAETILYIFWTWRPLIDSVITLPPDGVAFFQQFPHMGGHSKMPCSSETPLFAKYVGTLGTPKPFSSCEIFFWGRQLVCRVFLQFFIPPGIISISEKTFTQIFPIMDSDESMTPFFFEGGDASWTDLRELPTSANHIWVKTQNVFIGFVLNSM